MTRIFAIGTALLLTTSFAAADGIVGRHSVKGANPGGGGSYSGSVDVVKTGDTYKVTWKIGGDVYTGTGIGDDDFLAVSYKSGSTTGIALYGHKDDTWQGVWTYADGKTIGTEVWK